VKAWWLVVLGACRFVPGQATTGTDCSTGCSPGSDAFLDAGHNCFGAGAFIVCLGDADLPTGPFDVSTPTQVDTTACALTFTPPAGGTWCVEAGTSITISSALTAIGPHPLVLLATQDIDVTSTGSVDVSSTILPPTIGAGANAPACQAPIAPGDNNGVGGGGAAGGSFGTLGGHGGAGTHGTGGSGGIPGASAFLPVDTLRGGCAGGKGGDGVVAASGGEAGNGGGAVLLVAGGQIVIAGSVAASGAGGHHGLAGRGGGGGGGAGGMIVFAAATTTLTGNVVANGGGGGAGCANSGCGFDGGDPVTATPQIAALGGAKNNPTGNAGPGANGAVGTMPGAAAIDADGGIAGSGGDGAGAGGGGVGIIRILVGVAPNGPNVSPPATN
jgi:hypothetical protein